MMWLMQIAGPNDKQDQKMSENLLYFCCCFNTIPIDKTHDAASIQFLFKQGDFSPVS